MALHEICPYGEEDCKEGCFLAEQARGQREDLTPEDFQKYSGRVRELLSECAHPQELEKELLSPLA